MSLIEHFLSGEQNFLSFSVICVDLGGAGEHSQHNGVTFEPGPSPQ